MTLNKYEVLASKYIISDLQPARLPSTTLSNILKTLEAGDKYISNTALVFLKRRKLLALLRLAEKEYSFTEYLSAAKLEQKERYLEEERKEIQELLLQTKLKEERKKSAVARQKAEAERRRAYDNDPRNIAKLRQNKLRNKYNLSWFIERIDFPKLMKILQQIDKNIRLSKKDLIWLNTEGEDYFTDELRNRHHNIEANFYANDFNNKKDPWLAVNASSHYRKCNHAHTADSMLEKIKTKNLKNKRLKSALFTTHGGVKRDLEKSEEAIALGTKAHKLTPKDFRPCTLLGAINMEIGSYDIGQSWYAKAIQNGFTEKSMDYELRSIFMRSNGVKKESLRKHLLKIDPERYNWANKK